MTTGSEIRSAIEASRKDLLNLGLRNPLLNYRDTRGRGVVVTGENPARMFDVLVRKRRSMSFLAHPGQDDDEDDSLAQPEFDGAANQSDNRLQTAESSTSLQRRLLNTYRTANTLLEEQGVNTLFLALGMAVWHEADASRTPHRAPLVLVPVAINREGVDRNFHIEYTGEEIGANLSFIEKARTEFSIEVPGEIPSLAPNGGQDAEDLDVEAYFDAVAESFGDLSRWHVDTGSVVLGFFSFTKFLMYRDLDPDQWQEMLDHGIIRSLFGSAGFSEPPSAIEDDEHLDERLSPEDVFHVVDADSSQALAIVDANSERNLVVQGPPGTGKSQTITNILAQAMGHGKKVLFVAEKMAALEVVKRRLDRVGLGDACLELHSHKTTKRAVLDELQRSLDLGKPRRDGISEALQSLAHVRAGLNEYADAVNQPVGDSGASPYTAYGELLRIKSEYGEGALPRLTIDGASLWAKPEFERKRGPVADVQARLRSTGVPKDHPFWGSQLRRSLLPTERAALKDRINEAAKSVDTLVNASRELARSLRLDTPADLSETDRALTAAESVVESPDLKGANLTAPEWTTRQSEIRELINAGEEMTGIHAKYDQTLWPAAWNADVLQTRHILNTKGRSFWRFLSSDYKQAKKQLATLCRGELPKEIQAQADLTTAILEEKQYLSNLTRLSPVGASALGDLWRGDRTDWRAAVHISGWICALVNDISAGKVNPGVISSLEVGVEKSAVRHRSGKVQEAYNAHLKIAEAVQSSLELDNSGTGRFPNGLAGLSFDQQRRLFSDWSEQIDLVSDMVGFNVSAHEARKQGLHHVVELAEGWADAHNSLVTCFDQAWFESILSRAFNERPCLNGFDSNIHEKSIESFREMDRLSLEHNRARVADVHWKNLPKGGGEGQVAILTREFNKRSRHIPIRQLMTRAGNAIQAIKPVFMMSPLSIATYLPSDTVKFDLVVFDEASQVRPMEALGALVRASKAVVVGDSRQLPPTNFFESITRSGTAEEDNVTADIESVLVLFLAQNAPSTRLKWHYRSRHESLIALSNREFYENSLVVFPSPDAARESLGLRFHHLPYSVYDRGRSRVNRLEAEAVAQAVMQHARDCPNLTLGVAAFSSHQAQAILDELEKLRKQDSSRETFFNDHPEEPFFVKNLENVQGDERDVIFISVGYGRDDNGRVYQNFGPINNDGGERRLNVIITRAKRRCHVFTNLTADDIALGEGTKIGVRAFRAFLAYAQTGILESDMPSESGRDYDSPFQRAVAAALRGKGYSVTEEVASGGYFVDLAIRAQDSPGRYILGIECDGAMYHSARSARDRDRLRESVLEGLGWKLHRIWSTDWFKNPGRELQRAAQAIENAMRSRQEERDRAEQSNRTLSAPEPGPGQPFQRDEREEPGAGPGIPPYVIADLDVDTGGIELHELPSEILASYVERVVSVEWPVHFDEMARRVANGTELNRVGSRIRAALNHAVDTAIRRNRIVRRDDFLSIPGAQVVARDRSGFPQARKINLISKEEIIEAVEIVVKRSYGIDRPEASAAAAKLLGFGSVTQRIRAEVDTAISYAVANKELVDGGGHLTLPN